MMYLEKFMNENSDWQAKLAAAPYFIDIKQDSDYFILKYNMIMSDFSRPEVVEARGSIFRCDAEGHWFCVCHPFDKFFNYGEPHAATPNMNWDNISVQQKVDGSLVKFWFDKGEWHISTNGTIDAAKAECGSCNYLMLIQHALECNGGSLDEFCDMLDPKYCYMFELTTPFNRIVVHYKGYHLYCRYSSAGRFYLQTPLL